LGTDDTALEGPKKRRRQNKQEGATGPEETPKAKAASKAKAKGAPKAKASSSKSGGGEQKEKPKRKQQHGKEIEPESTKETEPESTKETEPESTKETEPESTKESEAENTKENKSEKRKKTESQKGKEVETEGSTAKKRKATPKTAPAPKAASKRKAEKVEASTTKRKSATEDDGQNKTWAGRWVPTDPVALSKFESIKTVFYEKIAPKVKAPSTLQNAFFKLVNNAFKSLSPEARKKDYLACARKNVEKFLADEFVRT